jgi:uncharacterized protein
MQRKVVIIGGSGFIGTKLTEKLLSQGYFVIVVDIVPPRIIHESLSFLKANFSVEVPDPTIFDGIYGIINLAGVTIGKRWNAQYQKLIYSSRILTTRAIVGAIEKTKNKPQVLVSASAVGYYGDRKEELLTEISEPGTDFLAKLCVDWEAEAVKAELMSVRVVRIRTAHVLGPGGLLSTLEPIFRKGFGGYFGNGNQYMPWVHYRDVVGIYVFALEHSISGAFNVGAGESITQKQLFGQFAKVIQSPIPFLLRIPNFVATIVLGKFAESLVTGQNTDSSKIKQAGYQYLFEDVSISLSDIYGSSPQIP